MKRFIPAVREGQHYPNPHPFMTNVRNLPFPFRRFLKGNGIFGSGDFAHSLMILYGESVTTSLELFET
jgi:hypothetical protein